LPGIFLPAPGTTRQQLLNKTDMKKTLTMIALAATLAACNNKESKTDEIKIDTDNIREKVEESMDEMKEKMQEAKDKLEEKMEKIRDTMKIRMDSLKKKI
jgi:outer membrane PBP1 activator LpoA protein